MDTATTILSSPVLDQLVSRVKEEVTRKFQPLLDNLGSLSQPAQTPHYVPAPYSSGSTFQPTQGPASQIQDAVEVPAVHDRVQSVLVSLSGEQHLLPGTQRPNDVFMSVNLPIGAKFFKVNLLILALLC